jgi:hypothetical protein
MPTIRNIPLVAVPAEGDPSFPNYASLSSRDTVGGSAANRQHISTRSRTLTLRERINLTEEALNDVCQAGPGSSWVFLPRDGTSAMAGNLSLATAYKVVNSAAPTAPADLTTKAYVDAADANLQAQIDVLGAGSAAFLRIDGSNAMVASLNLGANRIRNVANPVDAQDAVTRSWAVANLAELGETAVQTFSGKLQCPSTAGGDPATTLATKDYVLGAAGNYVSKTGDTMTGALVISGAVTLSPAGGGMLLESNVALYGKEPGGATRLLIWNGAGGETHIGDVASPLTIDASGGIVLGAGSSGLAINMPLMNATALKGYDATLTSRDIAILFSDNYLYLGDPVIATILRGTGIYFANNARINYGCQYQGLAPDGVTARHFASMWSDGRWSIGDPAAGNSLVLLAANLAVYVFNGADTGTVWHSLNDGPSSGLNADLLDSVEAWQFLRRDVDDAKLTDFNMGAHVIHNLANPYGDSHAVNRGWANATYPPWAHRHCTQLVVLSASSGSWQVPAGVTEIWALVVGGGGGGGGGAGGGPTGQNWGGGAGGGGGAGQSKFSHFYVTPLSWISYQCGSAGVGGPGGASGTDAPDTATNGGSSWLFSGPTIRAYGGVHGHPGTIPSGGPGTGGTGGAGWATGGDGGRGGNSGVSGIDGETPAGAFNNGVVGSGGPYGGDGSPGHGGGGGGGGIPGAPLQAGGVPGNGGNGGAGGWYRATGGPGAGSPGAAGSFGGGGGGGGGGGDDWAGVAGANGGAGVILILYMHTAT